MCEIEKNPIVTNGDIHEVTGVFLKCTFAVLQFAPETRQARVMLNLVSPQLFHAHVHPLCTEAAGISYNPFKSKALKCLSAMLTQRQTRGCCNVTACIDEEVTSNVFEASCSAHAVSNPVLWGSWSSRIKCSQVIVGVYLEEKNPRWIAAFVGLGLDTVVLYPPKVNSHCFWCLCLWLPSPRSIMAKTALQLASPDLLVATQVYKPASLVRQSRIQSPPESWASDGGRRSSLWYQANEGFGNPVTETLSLMSQPVPTAALRSLRINAGGWGSCDATPGSGTVWSLVTLGLLFGMLGLGLGLRWSAMATRSFRERLRYIHWGSNTS